MSDYGTVILDVMMLSPVNRPYISSFTYIASVFPVSIVMHMAVATLDLTTCTLSNKHLYFCQPGLHRVWSATCTWNQVTYNCCRYYAAVYTKSQSSNNIII